MPNFNADQTIYLETPSVRSRVNRLHGRVRYMHSLFRAPPSGAAPAIADKIIWGKLPVGARILGHMSRMDWTTGTASCTLNLGDQQGAARHLAATAITTAGSVVPAASVFTGTCLADTTLSSDTLTNVRGIGVAGPGDVLSGTGIPTGAFVVSIDRANRTVKMSALATATGANITVTAAGSPYDTGDDSSNAANGYASATDDCTLMSTVAGAQIANNQVISLQIAYVCD
jgi:hypothetical protein